MLRRSLNGLASLVTGGEFTYVIVVADNDREESAREVVAEFRASNSIEVTYCNEPEQNIALARNRALENATGDFVAFIDDDEVPAPGWLYEMVIAYRKYAADAVLGPVRPTFDQQPPAWLVRGRFCERPELPSGTKVHWKYTRTGNVLFRRDILSGVAEPFRREFGNGGEDQDFFRRLSDRGFNFFWCNEAVVYEVVPPERWNRRYLFRRALLRGQNERHLLSFSSVLKSMVAVPAYGALIPITLIFGHHFFVKYAIRLLDHAGKLLAAAGFKPLGNKYLGA